MTKITVLPFGGLGNRMRVIASAELLAERLACPLLNLVWLRKWELNAPVFSVFEPFKAPFHLVSGMQNSFFLYFVKHIYVQKYEKIYRKVLGFYYDLVLFDDDIKGKTSEEVLGFMQGRKRILIATCYGLNENLNFKIFKPAESVLKRLAKLQLPEQYVGVHIRRTDHSVIIQESGLDKFIKACRIEIEQDEKVKFFLATDDEAVKVAFNQYFGERILTQKTELSRNSEDGIQGAFADILALAGANKLICNLKSSFAETAIKLGSIKNVIEL